MERRNSRSSSPELSPCEFPTAVLFFAEGGVFPPISSWRMKRKALGHVAVMTEEVVQALSFKEGGVYVDATFGRGGHTRAILGTPFFFVCVFYF